MNIEIRRYKRTRFWAVYVSNELLAVVVYKRGAESIVKAISVGDN
ncbi:MAG: hypothetical protein R3F07_03970 [Opitutaceae bacterium]